MSTALSSWLRQHRDGVLAAWSELSDTIPEIASLPREKLRDHLAQVLDDAASDLESAAEGRGAGRRKNAREHAVERMGEGVSLESVVREYGLLRRALGRALEGGRHHDPSELERLHSAIDRAVRETVAAYARASSERHEKERAQLRKALDLRDRVLGIVSHDLRDPLSAILLLAGGLARADTFGPKERRWAERIASSAERATRLVRDLLDFTRTRAGSVITLELRPTRLDTLAAHVVAELSAAHPTKRITLELRAGADREVVCDGDRIAQVLSNLCSNGAQHSAADRAVTVSVAVDDERARLGVHNHGEPIDPEMLEQIFEPFRQLGPRNAREGNVGLGLYIAQAVARAHGGLIEVSSSKGKGTTFCLVIPRLTAPRPSGGGVFGEPGA